MILDLLSNAERYAGAHPRLAAGFEFLRKTDLAALPLGRLELDGTNLYALVGEDPGRGEEAAKLEVHRKYLDIQCTVNGVERIGWAPRPQAPDELYNPEKDIAFLPGQPELWFEVPAGAFAVFFPADAHAPLAGTGRPRKVVVKVRL